MTEKTRVVLTLDPNLATANADPLTWDWGCILSGLVNHVRATGTWIHIAVYEHRGGTNTRAFLSAEGAQAWRQEIAEREWDSMIEEEFIKPANPAEAADFYFERMGNCAHNSEYFSVFYENLED